LPHSDDWDLSLRTAAIRGSHSIRVSLMATESHEREVSKYLVTYLLMSVKKKNLSSSSSSEREEKHNSLGAAPKLSDDGVGG